MTLSNDILYNIYFYINDYCTASNFWLLSKDFNKNYMKKYNKTYKHKFMLLFNDIFTFFSLMPFKNNTHSDIDFYELITVQIAKNSDKVMLRNDIYFIYRTIKNFFFYYLTSNNTDPFYFSILKNISYAAILQGHEFLLDNIKIEFNRNLIKITNKYKREIFLDNLMNLEKSYENYDELRLQITMIQ